MPHSQIAPKLRSIEVVVIPDKTHGRALMLRDTEGVAGGAVVVPIKLAPIVVRFDGKRSVRQVADDASEAIGHAVPMTLVRRLIKELDEALMLDTPHFRARKREVVTAFTAASVRPAAHAGGSYHGDASELTRYIEVECLGQSPPREAPGRIVALAAPHMDLWRAAAGYGHAYRALGDALDPAADTFILLGTSHAPMQRPFAVCEKAFDTPLGALPPDHALIAELEKASRFDIRADEYLHKQEHSLEFQAVFLKHLLGRRRARIVPILCGLGEAQERRRDPSRDAEAESFLSALNEACRRREGRVVVVAGADLAHVGPRFGDAKAPGERELTALRARDMASLRLALGQEPAGFFEHVAEDLSVRRVCGLGPLYTLLRVLPEDVRGELLHYAQCVDPNEGSVVSHGSLGFYASKGG
jgi:AmmeMemoRadiSam system protein B